MELHISEKLDQLWLLIMRAFGAILFSHEIRQMRSEPEDEAEDGEGLEGNEKD